MKILFQSGPLHPGWKGDDVKYRAAHIRLEKLRGKATEHVCSCGKQAAQWSYDHKCPNEKIENRRGFLMPFSIDPSHYEPLCASCHRYADER